MIAPVDHLISLSNNIDGILVEKENIEKLAEAISTLITDEEKRKEMGTAAFKNVLRFSPDHIYEKWEQFFK